MLQKYVFCPDPSPGTPPQPPKLSMKRVLLLLLGTAPGTLAQRMLRGVVANGETGEVLPFANVFLANTTKGTTTDQAGQFQLLNLPVGRYDLVASYVGFETFSFPIQTDTARFYKILLKPQTNELATVTVRARRDPAWASRLQTFKTQFIGQSANARQCRLLNPDTLWFSSDSVYSLQAGAREPANRCNWKTGRWGTASPTSSNSLRFRGSTESEDQPSYFVRRVPGFSRNDAS